jgi:hypothetical protein
MPTHLSSWISLSLIGSYSRNVDRIASLMAGNASTGLACAPPRGSGMMVSITPRRTSSDDVMRSASVAWSGWGEGGTMRGGKCAGRAPAASRAAKLNHASCPARPAGCKPPRAAKRYMHQRTVCVALRLFHRIAAHASGDAT